MCREFEFKWNGGFNIKQKQKNITNLHASIELETQEPALEVSSKGTSLGSSIGAFSLSHKGYPIENVFQSAKKFEQGGPYKDLLLVTPREAKKDERIRNSGEIVAFILDDEEWATEPQSLFYDYIYIQALLQLPKTERNQIDAQLQAYDWFTDIEFNPKKSINCQARSVAIYKLIQQKDRWDCLKNQQKWRAFHLRHVTG